MALSSVPMVWRKSSLAVDSYLSRWVYAIPAAAAPVSSVTSTTTSPRRRSTPSNERHEQRIRSVLDAVYEDLGLA